MDSQDSDEAGAEAGLVYENDTALLQQAWMNERSSPEILHHKTELVERTLDAVHEQEERIELLGQEAARELECTVYKRELTRIKYLLRSYLRARLSKVEAHVLHILMRGDLTDRLSDAEKDFANGFTNMLSTHFDGNVLDHMPEQFQNLLKSSEARDDDDMIPTPNLDEHVFCRVKKDVGNFELDEDETVDLGRGDIYLIRFRPVRQLLADDDVELI